MPTIHIEDTLWQHPGFQDFMILCGSRKLAKANVLEAFEIAQRYWYPDQMLVPEIEMQRLDIPVDDLIKCRLAERRESGIYVKGSKKAFAWLFTKKKPKSKPRESSVPVDKLEGAIADYPRKERKAEALSRLAKQIENESQLVEFQKAVSNYAKHCKAKNKSKQYIMQLATFVGTEKSGFRWREWLSPEKEDLMPDNVKNSANDHLLAEIEEMEVGDDTW